MNSKVFFTSPYNEQKFFSFIKRFLGKDEFEDGDKKKIVLDNYNFLTSYRHLGSITIDNNGISKTIPVLEIYQRSFKDARVGITKEAIKLLKQRDIFTGYYSALVVFISDKQPENWRFSLIKSDDGSTRNNAKRFSYYLGKEEGYKTPKQYLIDKGPIKDFADLISRFDVEVVRKEFFDTYLELFVRLYIALNDDIELANLLKSQQVDLVSFTKNLLGKIVFLYFLQQKGWLGLGRERKEYGEGDKDFMRTLRKNFEEQGESLATEKTGNFYNDYLEWLFYDGINTDRRDDDDRFPNLKMKVPYLNGGLFKEEYRGREDNKAKIDNTIFSNIKTKGENADGILDVFDRYNFTVDEDSLYDTNVAVDPEMLGRIFEKMISISSENIDEVVNIYKNKGSKKLSLDNELNKKLGAFYTPREIVHYMTKESLIAYLVNALQGNKTINEGLIRNLFTLKEEFLVQTEDLVQAKMDTDIFEKLIPLIVNIDTALKKVKILDPAVGSGAFPMGLLHEISSLRYYIYGKFNKQFDDIDMYRENPADTSSKLSMYEFKRHIILNNIYGVDIDPGAIDIAKLRFWLSLVVDEEQPHPLPNFEFKFVVANTLIPLAEEEKNNQLFSQDIPKLETLKKYMREYYNAESQKSKQELRDRIRSYTAEEQQNLFSEIPLRAKQIAEFGDNFDNPKHSHSFFDPSLMMSEWRGFDIVIGNPPYVDMGKMDKQFRDIFINNYGNINLYSLFIELGLNFLSKKGNLIFITQNSFLFSIAYSDFRNYLLNNITISMINDFGDGIFENANVASCVIQILKTNSYKEIEILHNFNKFRVSDQKKFSYNIDYVFSIYNTIADDIIIEKMVKENNKLSHYITIQRGIESINREKYYDYKIDNKLYKKLLLGKGNLDKYCIKSYLYMEYIPNKKEYKGEEIFEQEKLIIPEGSDKIIAIPDSDGYYTTRSIYCCVGSNNLLIKYIAALINSKLYEYYVKKMIAGNSGYVKLRIQHIKNLPMIELNEKEQQPFIDLVDQILDAKRSDPDADTSALESQIDQLVYKLYNLTDEEIRLVEKSVG